MNVRKALFASLIAASAIAAPAVSQARTYVDVDVAPPPARVEHAPSPRAGYVWVPGAWDYNGHKHVWVKGHWVRERHGHHWVEDRWVQNGDRWHHDRGHWDHD
jgi:hypothetical protein